MAIRFTMPRGTLVSPIMSADYQGALVTIRYYDAGGAEITPTAEAALTAFRDPIGGVARACPSVAAGQWAVNGPVVRFQVDLTGTGAASAELDIWRMGLEDSSLLPQLFTGTRAVTTQSYIEANTKNGLQFYLQYSLPQLASGATHKVLFTTGAKKVLIKGREMYAIGEQVSIQLYKQPTAPAPGGTLLAVQNYNDVNPVVSTVAIRGGAATTADGTVWGDPQRLFGQSAAGQRTGSGLAPGGDRILKANSTYLVVFRNLGSGTADIDYFLTWYEGAPDLPLR